MRTKALMVCIVGWVGILVYSFGGFTFRGFTFSPLVAAEKAANGK